MATERQIISISLDKKTVEFFDKLQFRLGFKQRSYLIRWLLLHGYYALNDEGLKPTEAEKNGVLTPRPDLAKRLAQFGITRPGWNYENDG